MSNAVLDNVRVRRVGVLMSSEAHLMYDRVDTTLDIKMMDGIFVKCKSTNPKITICNIPALGEWVEIFGVIDEKGVLIFDELPTKLVRVGSVDDMSLSNMGVVVRKCGSWMSNDNALPIEQINKTKLTYAFKRMGKLELPKKRTVQDFLNYWKTKRETAVRKWSEN